MKLQMLGTIGAGLAVALSGSAYASVSPIGATGWNHDMVINGSAPYNTTIDGTMDGGFGQPENWTWVEAGTYPIWNGSMGVDTAIGGLVAGAHSSLTGNGTFEFQPFDRNNVIGLDGGASGTLSLTTPAQYSTIALYGASGFGPKTATITLTFDDLSTSDYFVASGTGIGTDWFNNNADAAYYVGNRASNRSEEGYTILYHQQSDAIHINESFFTLSPADAAKTLESVTITNTGGDRMAVFALSGEAIPEPASIALLSVGALLLVRRR